MTVFAPREYPDDAAKQKHMSDNLMQDESLYGFPRLQPSLVAGKIDHITYIDVVFDHIEKRGPYSPCL